MPACSSAVNILIRRQRQAEQSRDNAPKKTTGSQRSRNSGMSKNKLISCLNTRGNSKYNSVRYYNKTRSADCGGGDGGDTLCIRAKVRLKTLSAPSESDNNHEGHVMHYEKRNYSMVYIRFLFLDTDQKHISFWLSCSLGPTKRLNCDKLQNIAQFVQSPTAQSKGGLNVHKNTYIKRRLLISDISRSSGGGGREGRHRIIHNK